MLRNWRRVAATLGAGAMLALAGCNILAPAAYILHGPPKTPAAFTGLDANRPTVIFIDDAKPISPKRSLRQRMGEAAEQDMMRRGIVDEASMISSRSAMAAVNVRDSFNERISVVDLGRELGAEVVIWVEMKEWTLSRDGASLSPTVGAQVKIVDTVANKRIWPAEEAGFPLRAQMPERSQSVVADASTLDLYHEQLAAYAGREIARLFYSYERDSLQSQRSF